MVDMDIELKTQWVNALRSGNYKQGKSQLRMDDEYCCLGVLCDLIDPDGWSYKAQLDAWWWRDPETNDVRDTYLPISTAERVFGDKVNKEVEVPVLSRFGDNKTCSYDTAGAVMNDAGNTFDEIADWIEDNL